MTPAIWRRSLLSQWGPTRKSTSHFPPPRALLPLLFSFPPPRPKIFHSNWELRRALERRGAGSRPLDRYADRGGGTPARSPPEPVAVDAVG
ncbi:unnamed protein product [Urochloa humidicola]